MANFGETGYQESGLMSGEKIAEQFTSRQEEFSDLEKKVTLILQDMISSQRLHIHTLSSRIKSPDSLSQKISRPDRIYHSIAEISDLVGFRIVTYFESDIDQLAACVEKTFRVDLVRSVDKRKIHDSSHFGYLSLHYICYLPPDDVFAEIPFEIQIRSILQHAWAEIEHDLGYKGQEGTPLHIRRKFSRLAGILEMADEEFCSIRSYLKNYQQSMDQRITDRAQEIKTDEVSLSAYIKTSKIRSADEAIARDIGITPDDSLFFPDYLIRLLHFLDIRTIKDLDRAFNLHRDNICRFVAPYFEFTKKTWNFGTENLDRFPRGYSVFFLGHLVAFQKHSLKLRKIDYMSQFYSYMDHIEDSQELRAVASGFVEIIGRHI